MTTIKDKDRIIYLDILRVISILAVIIIHVITPIKTKYYIIDIDIWWISNIYNSISKWTVPIMVMVSGALLLDPKKEYTLRNFFDKRFNKVFIPFLFWGIIYTIWKYRFEEISLQIIFNTIKDFLIGPVYYHLWFIYVILGLYILTPVLRVYIKNATEDNIKYFLIIWFITSIISIISIAKGVKPLIELYFFTGFIGYYILGYYLNKIQTKNINAKLSCPTLIIGFLISMIGTFIFTKKNGTLSELAVNAFAPNIIIMSISIFIITKNIDWKKIVEDTLFYKYIIEIGSLSFGIYLIHVLILEFLELFKFNATMFNPILGIPFISLIVFIFSYILIRLMKKIPIIEKIVP